MYMSRKKCFLYIIILNMKTTILCDLTYVLDCDPSSLKLKFFLAILRKRYGNDKEI